MILAVSGWGEGGRGVPLLAEVVSCHEGSVFVPSYISRGTPRAAKGAAASTSSQPQAVMDSSADTSAPLASRLAGGESLGGSCRNRLLKGACPQTKTTQTERQPTRTEAHQERVPPQALWKRSGQHEPRRVPGRGAPLIGVVFRWAHTFQRSRLSSGTGFQRSRPHQNDTRQEPKRTGSGYPHRRFLEAKRTA